MKLMIPSKGSGCQGQAVSGLIADLDCVISRLMTSLFYDIFQCEYVGIAFPSIV